ncbi:hypothetical protein, partial [Olsenella uli]|uniref:hypothetical protein n=1 Tax=Olsenella uli TaxID=133926 RepID=UPI003D78E2D8
EAHVGRGLAAAGGGCEFTHRFGLDRQPGWRSGILRDTWLGAGDSARHAPACSWESGFLRDMGPLAVGSQGFCAKRSIE